MHDDPVLRLKRRYAAHLAASATPGAEPPTGRMTFFRVCDWWRREGGLLSENWVFVDIPHAMLQSGVDVFASRAVPA